MRVSFVPSSVTSRQGTSSSARSPIPRGPRCLPWRARLWRTLKSPLSHAAIVAREYGIPAVLGTQHATATIPNGARVLVDGTAGVVKIQPDAGA